MNRIVQCVAGICVIAIAGCSSTARDLKNLDERAVCCASFRDVDIVKVLGKEPVNLEIDSSSPVFAFGSGKAFFEGLMFDAVPENSHLHVRTFFYGATAIDGHYFYPGVTFLDGDRNPLATSLPEGLKFESFGWDGKATWVATMAIPTNARFALFHTPRGKVDTKYSGPAYAYGSTYMIGKTILTTPGGNITAVGRFGGTGRIAVSLLSKN
jgi:hypothetical protein